MARALAQCVVVLVVVWVVVVWVVIFAPAPRRGRSRDGREHQAVRAWKADREAALRLDVGQHVGGDAASAVRAAAAVAAAADTMQRQVAAAAATADAGFAARSIALPASPRRAAAPAAKAKAKAPTPAAKVAAKAPIRGGAASGSKCAWNDCFLQPVSGACAAFCLQGPRPAPGAAEDWVPDPTAVRRR